MAFMMAPVSVYSTPSRNFSMRCKRWYCRSGGMIFMLLLVKITFIEAFARKGCSEEVK